MGFDKSSDEFLMRQVEILHEQGKTWLLNLPGWHPGWHDHNQTLPICDWQGITCDPVKVDVVIGIELKGLGLAGPISPQLGSLSSLMYINLSENYLSGTIPTEISSLPSLNSVYLHHNRLSGIIPSFQSAKLEVLTLSHNSFHGIEYPWRVEDLDKNHNHNEEEEYSLNIFDASYNSIKGTISENIGILSKLTVFDLSYNKFHGTIPTSIGTLKSLKYLVLNNNNLVGTIPPSLTNSDLSLVDLLLDHNDLSGTIPTALANIRYLENLHIHGNKFTGAVPSSLCRLNLNEELFRDYVEPQDINNNPHESRDGCNSIVCPANTASKDGYYPCTHCGDQGYDWYLGNVGRCQYLNERVLLDSIYESTNGEMWKEGTGWTMSNVDKCLYSGVECNGSGHVVAINLTDHGLTGTIPREFGMFQYLKSLDLSKNLFTGFLPSDIRFTPLEYLDISSNELEGIVPPMLCLTGDINGNGKNGDFNCNIIACPEGTWSPIGRASPLDLHIRDGRSGGERRENENYSCKPCHKSHTYLGSRICGGAKDIGGGNGRLIPDWNQLGSGEYAAMITLPLAATAFIILGAVAFAIMRRRRMSYTMGKPFEKDGLQKDSTNTTYGKNETLSVTKKSDKTYRKASIETVTSGSALDFNYDPESSDDEDILDKKIGAELPYMHTATSSRSLHSTETREVDRAMNYPPAPQSDYSQECKSFVASSEASSNRSVGSDIDTGGGDNNVTENTNVNMIRSARGSGVDDGSLVGFNAAESVHSMRSRGSRSSSRLSHQAELWLDVPDPT